MRVHPSDEKRMPAGDTALLIDVGWLDLWPLHWTRAGKRAVRRHANGHRSYDGRALLAEAATIHDLAITSDNGPSRK